MRGERKRQDREVRERKIEQRGSAKEKEKSVSVDMRIIATCHGLLFKMVAGRLTNQSRRN